MVNICHFRLSIQARSPAAEEARFSQDSDRLDSHLDGGVVSEGRGQGASERLITAALCALPSIWRVGFTYTRVTVSDV